MLIIAVVVYLILAVLTYGITFAYFQGEYKGISDECYYDDMNFALCMSVLAPLSTIVALYATEFAKHGLKLK